MEDNPTFQHLTCRGVSYHETAAGDTNVDGTPAPTDCPHTIFLPVNDGRMIALNADTGKPCDSFADHGTLDLPNGMGVKTAGFYEPTSPPVVSNKILVIGGAVIDNYSTQEPSGVIRGFRHPYRQADLGLGRRRGGRERAAIGDAYLYEQFSQFLDDRVL